MSHEILDCFKTTGALLDGHFKLTSGRHSNTYFQCAKLLQYPGHLMTICNRIVCHFSGTPIDAVISPAIGGIVVGTEVGRQLGIRTIFAERVDGVMSIRRDFEIGPGDRILVVEDVITTGGSVREVLDLVLSKQATVVGVGSVVDRSNGSVRLAENQHSVLTMKVESWEPQDCPLCSQGTIPLVKPGSRGN